MLATKCVVHSESSHGRAISKYKKRRPPSDRRRKMLLRQMNEPLNKEDRLLRLRGI